eukprot:12417365-Karenia_brevis.AAC.1
MPSRRRGIVTAPPTASVIVTAVQRQPETVTVAAFAIVAARTSFIGVAADDTLSVMSPAPLSSAI